MKNSIKCPNCDFLFAVEDAFSEQVESKVRLEYQTKLEEQIAKFKSREQSLRIEKQEFEQLKQKENELFKKRLDKKLEEERRRLEMRKEEERALDRKLMEEERQSLIKSLKTSIQSEYEIQLKFHKEELEAKAKAIEAFREKELEMERLKRQIHDDKKQWEIDFEKRIIKEREEYEGTIISRENERHALKMKEYEKKLDDQRKLIEEMQRKADQGSMQLQGEVLELELESLLQRHYPFDLIEEVGKGIKGADVIQTVINPSQAICGKIIYETKRTKNFSESWINKLKSDQINAQADIAVLVTQSMPKDMSSFGHRDGVWICGFEEIPSVSFALRHMLIRLERHKAAETNRGDKMSMVYSFLTSEEFRQRIEAIVEGFSGLKAELDREKRAMQRIWKEREKQIDKVITNTIDMYGAIKGIAGSSVKRIEALELDVEEDNLLLNETGHE